jgi:hypothetical protein
MPSGDAELWPGLCRSWARLEMCLLDPFPTGRDLATSAIELFGAGLSSPLVSSSVWSFTSPLSNWASLAERLRSVRLVVREMVARELDLLPLVELPLLEVLRDGFEFLPRPRPLCI